MVDISLAGALLVASPALDDPNFARTVILLLDHDSDGALGVVLNRPTEVSAEDALPRWAEVASAPAVVHVGGPVTPDAVVCLGRIRRGQRGEPPEGWMPLTGPVGAVDLDSEPDDLVDQLDAFRVFAGYSGWGPGQLEAEVRLGGWLVLGAEPDDAFSEEPETLWSRVLRRQGGELAFMHTMPLDPTQN
ncbi:MAG: putative transcriptional regulator [Actinomycetota bacterium]|jgi:putative transcriptional regulator|nr:putative transcriptional regulator [Actinomycetota bacterium]